MRPCGGKFIDLLPVLTGPICLSGPPDSENFTGERRNGEKKDGKDRYDRFEDEHCREFAAEARDEKDQRDQRRENCVRFSLHRFAGPYVPGQCSR